MSAPEVFQLSFGPLTGVAFSPDRTRTFLLSIPLVHSSHTFTIDVAVSPNNNEVHIYQRQGAEWIHKDTLAEVRFLSCLVTIIALTRRHAHLSTTSSSLPSHGLPIRTVSSPAPKTVTPTSGLLPSLDGSPPSSCSVSTVPRHVSSGVPTKTSLLSEAVRELLQSVTLMRRTIGGYQNMSRSL